MRKIVKIRISLICIFILVIGTIAYNKSKHVINIANKFSEDKSEVSSNFENEDNNENYTEDVDRMIFHAVDGSEEVTLPVEYKEDYTIYENKLYITLNKGETWLQVPEDSYSGYATIGDYLKDISKENIYISDKESFVLYGGRGAENICIISTEDGKAWGVTSISKTATHDTEKGYEKMYIDFLEDGKEGYIVAVRDDKGTKKFSTYRTVNYGATWDTVPERDDLHKEIIKHFSL